MTRTMQYLSVLVHRKSRSVRFRRPRIERHYIAETKFVIVIRFIFARDRKERYIRRGASRNAAAAAPAAEKVLRNDRLIVTNLTTGYAAGRDTVDLVFYNYNTTYDLFNYRAKIEILFAQYRYTH